MTGRLPPLAVSIAGLSGAGKTSLLERLLPTLVGRGLAVGYLKANAHRIDLDAVGKDTERVRRAGAVAAAVHGRGGGEKDPVHQWTAGSTFSGEAAAHAAAALLWNLRSLYAGCDLLLVEGMKGSHLPKILVNRLDNPQGTLPESDLAEVVLEFRWPAFPPRWEEEVARVEQVLLGLLASAARIHAEGLMGAVLAGGGSERMGEDKARLPLRGGGGTWLERAFLLLTTRCPEVRIVGRLSRAGGPDLPTLERPVPSHLDLRPGRGPLAGLETALRLAQGDAVLALSCDTPDLAPEILDRLLAARDPAREATAFRHPDGRSAPIPVLLEGRCRETVSQALAQGEGAIRRLLEGLSVNWVSMAPELERLLLSRNIPEDRRSYERGTS